MLLNYNNPKVKEKLEELGEYKYETNDSQENH